MHIHSIEFVTRTELFGRCQTEQVVSEIFTIYVKTNGIIIPVKIEDELLKNFKRAVFKQAEEIFTKEVQTLLPLHNY